MKSSKLITGLCCWLAVASANAACLASERLTGLNLAGAEFGSLPGELHRDYTYPSREELEALAAGGGNVVRLPIRWERVRPEANGPINASELQQVKATAETASALGLCLILDMHNYAEYYSETLTANTALNSAFTHTWSLLAAALPDAGHIALGLMNEPAHMPVNEWARLAQTTVNELRRRNHKHLILVSGGRWSGAHDWFSGEGADINAEAFANFSDPADNYAIEIHQYADSNYSGMHDVCKRGKDFEEIFSKLEAWARQHDKRLFLGEFGTAANPRCLETLRTFLNLTRQAPWLGWTYWAAGRWWNNYPMAISLDAPDASPQWKVLQPYLAGRGSAGSNND